VQIWGRDSESQVPAQIKPLLAMVTTVGSLDKKENVSLMTLFLAPRAVALSAAVLPTSSERLDPTADDAASDTLVGTALPVLTLVGLDCPQEARRMTQSTMQDSPARETNLPMNPSK
jgi:hypothetical protein